MRLRLYPANYILACDTFSSEVKHLFNILGIYRKKVRFPSIWKLYGTHLYGEFYHIVGNIIDRPKLQLLTK